MITNATICHIHPNSSRSNMAEIRVPPRISTNVDADISRRDAWVGLVVHGRSWRR
jgi:hypothetical protein